MDQQDQRNFILAIVLTIGVLLVYQFLVVEPEAKRRQAAIEAARFEQAQNPNAVPIPGAAPGQTGPLAPVMLDRTEALMRSQRVAFANERAIDGSINLTGARFDDLNLKRHRQELDPASAEVVLAAPEGTRDGLYASLSWTRVDGQLGDLPGPETVWSVISGAPLSPAAPLVLGYQAPSGLSFQRQITLDEDYLFTVTDTVSNTSAAAQAVRKVGQVRRFGVPSDLLNNGILHEGTVGVLGNTLYDLKYSEMRKGQAVAKPSQGGWLGVTDKLRLAALIPDPTDTVDAGFQMRRAVSGDVFEASFAATPREIGPGQSLTTTTHVYMGAKRVEDLQRVEQALGTPRFVDAIDWGMFWYLTKPFFWGLRNLADLLGSVWAGILALTVVIKLIMLPIVYNSYKSMAKMRDLAPKMKEIQERFAADKQRQQQEIMKMYQKEKVNPVSGCLPMLLQIPVFYALYKTLFVTIELRHAAFPGWIQDMSAPDPTTVFNLFGLLPFDPTAIPLIGGLLALGAWPILYGVTMWALQSLNPPPPDKIQQMIFAWFPVLFTVLFAGFAAGLVIYWTWSNVLSILQQYWIMRRQGSKTQLDKFLEEKFRKIKAQE
jgi:YidC/Oxa1 family membrane protein insertase